MGICIVLVGVYAVHIWDSYKGLMRFITLLYEKLSLTTIFDADLIVQGQLRTCKETLLSCHMLVLR